MNGKQERDYERANAERTRKNRTWHVSIPLPHRILSKSLHRLEVSLTRL